MLRSLSGGSNNSKSCAHRAILSFRVTVAMALFPASYSAFASPCPCSRLPTIFPSAHFDFTTPEPISLFGSSRRVLRRCRSLQRLRKAHALFCSLRPEDGSDHSEAEASQGFPVESETSTVVEHGNFWWVTHGFVTGLATVGFVETLYLTFMKLSGRAVSCSLGGASCNDVLDSDYAVVFGVPLSAVGALAYGTVALLGLLGITEVPVKMFGVDLIRWLLLGSTGAMASASAYFMYILSTKLEGASCTYCVASAFLSFSLLLLTLRRFNAKEIKEVAGFQLALTALVVAALSSAYTGIAPGLARSPDIDLPPIEPQVTTSSSELNLSLAKHLQSVGAKMYGAFWCSHCFEQKQLFGREAMKFVDYVECFPEGYRKGVKIAKACESANIQGFPTWIIKGESLSGEQKLSELARASGFDGYDASGFDG